MEYLATWEKRLQRFHKGFFLVQCAEHGLEIYLNRLCTFSNEQLKKMPELLRECYASKKDVFEGSQVLRLAIDDLGEWVYDNCYHSSRDWKHEYDDLTAARERYARSIESEREDQLYNQAIYSRKAMQKVYDGEYFNMEDYGRALKKEWY